MSKKLISCVLALLILIAVLPGEASAAKKGTFPDVPEKYWGYEYVEALAEGGLIHGYPDGSFGPEDKLTVDQMATIICNATGISVGAKNGYWAYKAVEHCRDIGCLPDLGDIKAANYNVKCTRELAVYMVSKALTAGAPEKKPELTYANIPDNGDITAQYRATILHAYRLGLLTGMDSAGTFMPKKHITRAQMCAIMARAGYTTIIEPVEPMTGAEIYSAVQAWGDQREWKDSLNDGVKSLTSTNPVYGGVSMRTSAAGYLTITMPECNTTAWVKNNEFVDAYGNAVSMAVQQNGYCDLETGKMVMSSGWSYEARQYVKEILKLAYPASYEDAYQAILSVMAQEIYERPADPLPAAVRWLDGRYFGIGLDNKSYKMFVYIGIPGEEDIYNDTLNATPVGNQTKYVPKNGTSRDIPAMFELDRG